MTYVKFVFETGGIVTDMNTNIIPRVGETVQFPNGMQASVTRVMTVYHKAGDWVLVTVGTEL